MKAKKTLTKFLCVFLCSLLIFMSPLSKSLDIKQMERVEASSVIVAGGIILTGVTTFYLLSHLYGYHTSNSHSS